MDLSKQLILQTESNAARQERTISRLCALIALLIVLLVGTNAGWIYYESQYQTLADTTTITQELDADSGNAIINDGVHINDGEN